MSFLTNTIILQRFRLISWSAGDLDKKVTSAYNDQFVKDTCAMSEEFLRVVTGMVTERTVGNMSEGISLREELRFRVVQVLCSSESTTHSAVVKNLEINEEDEPLVEELLQEVADFKTSAGVRAFELKEEFEQYFHPLYYYYLPEEQQVASGEIKMQFCTRCGLTYLFSLIRTISDKGQGA